MTSFSFPPQDNDSWVSIESKPIASKNIPEDVLLLELDGAVMRTFEGMYREFCAVFSFPDYFGNNLNALDECLIDLEWLPAKGYLVVIDNSSFLLDEESPEALESVLSILGDIGKEWSTPIKDGETWDREGIPFYTILIKDD